MWLQAYRAHSKPNASPGAVSMVTLMSYALTSAFYIVESIHILYTRSLTHWLLLWGFTKVIVDVLFIYIQMFTRGVLYGGS